MVTGRPVDEIVWVVGHTDGMNLSLFKETFEALGVPIGSTVYWNKDRRNHIPDFCIATIVDSRTTWAHAVAILDGLVYDPEIGWPIPVQPYEEFIIRGRYSRRYRSKSKTVQRKAVTAHWAYFIPILCDPPVPCVTLGYELEEMQK